jgi:2-polyprenyl-3-methyl-5-hydroxy-6-metoxy-1,4-benzoquinol methylase
VAEYRLFTGDVANVSTFGFHEHRERAPHLEQGVHRGRLRLAADMVREAVDRIETRITAPCEVIDLGCGDGGLLSLISHLPWVKAYGFDFQPSNEQGWKERNVNAALVNFVEDFDTVIPTADIYVMTEVLEHLTDPHGFVRKIRARADNVQLIASSPWTEHAGSHDECHAWAWDQEGYKQLMLQANFNVVRHETDGMFQVLHAVPRGQK